VEVHGGELGVVRPRHERVERLRLVDVHAAVYRTNG
jgi:hypothetical protein